MDPLTIRKDAGRHPRQWQQTDSLFFQPGEHQTMRLQDQLSPVWKDEENAAYQEPETAQPDFRGLPTPYEINERTKKGGASFVNSFLSYAVEPPKLADVALFGVAGSIVKKIEPHTETHPAAVLLQLLIGFGNMIGRGPHFVTECDKQTANLFCVVVGESSRGRKGTSWGHASRLLKLADSTWFDTRIMGGLASGEGVISELKDSDDEENEPPKDKRLLLFEGEFGSVLRVMQREGSTVSSMLRNAWDTGTLRNLANAHRNKKGESLRASDCHISIIGHITRAELSKLISENDSANGFANRILWVHSARTKLLPDGGSIKSVNFDTEIKMLKLATSHARTKGELAWSPEAKAYWRHIYGALTQDHPGRWGQVTSRGEAQVVRLSLLYALLDGGEQIGIEHLKAAESVWKYCSESARWAFMESRFSRHAQSILNALAQGPMSLTRISADVFKANVHRNEIEECIREIENEITITKQPTGGRDATVISLRAQQEEQK
ncbi:MAG: DUF3987 domain-containing protein [Verrucomicrobia bacterium]|nr:DUF3987 domain-containing protein [Verrucomicrobiota bacterium]